MVREDEAEREDAEEEQKVNNHTAVHCKCETMQVTRKYETTLMWVILKTYVSLALHSKRYERRLQ